MLDFDHVESLYRTAVRLLPDGRAAVRAVEETYRIAARQPAGGRAALFQVLFRITRHRRGRPQESGDPILSALDRLPAESREILLVMDVEEFSPEEAARILRIPVGSLRERLARARARALLRQEMQPQFAAMYAAGPAAAPMASTP